jgi:hypothetical protein
MHLPANDYAPQFETDILVQRFHRSGMPCGASIAHSQAGILTRELKEANERQPPAPRYCSIDSSPGDLAPLFCE